MGTSAALYAIMNGGTVPGGIPRTADCDEAEIWAMPANTSVPG